ncbi:TRAP transporter substrate-binding protein DctP, partial [Stutzerimonas kunmingensis]|uniref:TRAP transporter substrate-binding protein DctP n=1 Tax=Stutzerimonas kunmingensis TaxID=1211807 RepID=UPI0028A11FFA
MNLKRKLLVTALPFAFCVSGLAHAMTLKIAEIHPAGYPTVVAQQHMGEKIEKATDGELKFRMFSGGVLGSEKEVVAQVQLGAVQMTRVSLGTLGPVIPEVNAFNMPFVFRDHEHMRKVIDGEIGQEILDKITNSDFNMVALAWMDGGVRNLYTKKPVRKLEDLKGMKIRVIGNPLFIDTLNAMGAQGVAMDTGEIYSALQTGVIDGADNNPPTMLEHNHYREAKNYTLTGHLI